MGPLQRPARAARRRGERHMARLLPAIRPQFRLRLHHGDVRLRGPDNDAGSGPADVGYQQPWTGVFPAGADPVLGLRATPSWLADRNDRAHPARLQSGQPRDGHIGPSGADRVRPPHGRRVVPAVLNAGMACAGLCLGRNGAADRRTDRPQRDLPGVSLAGAGAGGSTLVPRIHPLLLHRIDGARGGTGRGVRSETAFGCRCNRTR